MTTTPIETRDLRLVVKSPDEVRAMLDGMTAEQRAELSADWLALVESATDADPWVHGFSMLQRGDAAVVGSCGFKGPPSAEGVVEIAYGVDPDHQGKGYATEAAQALADWSLSHPSVGVVIAHTLPEPNASTRVLTKCGFQNVGEVIDPEDGRVWRWEKPRESK